MSALVMRAIATAILVVLIAWVARKSPNLGGLIASIPLVSTLGMVWLWHDTQDTAKVADYSMSALIYFLPSIPMFVVIPLMLRQGHGFWPVLAAALAMTMALYWLTSRIAASYGMEL
jgi:F0F1-type ATP synthase assembly protein I